MRPGALSPRRADQADHGESQSHSHQRPANHRAFEGLVEVGVGVFSVLLEDPASDLNQAFESSMVRRALVGVALGLTMIGLISSSWGQRSGAHMNRP